MGRIQRAVAAAALAALAGGAFGAATAQAQGGGPAAIGALSSLGDAPSVVFLGADGSAKRLSLGPGRNPDDPPQVVAAPGGFAVAYDDENTGNVFAASLSAGGGFGPFRQLPGQDDAVLDSSPALVTGGQLVLAGEAVVNGILGTDLVVIRYSVSSGAQVSKSSFNDPRNFANGVSDLVAGAGGTIWALTPQGAFEGAGMKGPGMNFRRLSAQATVVGPVNFTVPRGLNAPSADALPDGSGGLFVLLHEVNRFSTPRSLRALHVSAAGALSSALVARAPRGKPRLNGAMAVRGGKANIVYSRYARGVPDGVFTRRFNTAGEVSRARRLARTGTIRDVSALGSSIRILRKRRGLRIHRLPLRGRLGRGRTVTGARNTSGGRLTYDASGRAYVSWAVPNDSSACGESNVLARVLGRTRRPVRTIASCGTVSGPLVLPQATP